MVKISKILNRKKVLLFGSLKVKNVDLNNHEIFNNFNNSVLTKIFLSHLRNVHHWKESEAAVITMSKSFEAIKTNCPSVCLSICPCLCHQKMPQEGRVWMFVHPDHSSLQLCNRSDQKLRSSENHFLLMSHFCRVILSKCVGC